MVSKEKLKDVNHVDENSFGETVAPEKCVETVLI